jgi:hypothetical protein
MRPAGTRTAVLLLIALSCVGIGASLMNRSRAWLHTTGSLHLWYHLVFFGMLGALALLTSRHSLSRLLWVVAVLLLGFAIELSQSLINHVAIEWDDVQVDCFGVAFGCLVVWLLSGKPKQP